MAYRRSDFDTGQDIQLIDGEFDVFGDGVVTCLPTSGHTPGHQSLRVQTEQGPIVLSADACYLQSTLEDLVLPRNIIDEEKTLESLQFLRAQRAAGARVLPGHDPQVWRTIPQAPERLA